MVDSKALTARDLVIEDATDAPDALVALLKRYPAITEVDYSNEVDAFGVLLRAWMVAHPNEILELHMDTGGYTYGNFVRADLPTDFFVDVLHSIIRPLYLADCRSIGLNAPATKLLKHVVKRRGNDGKGVHNQYIPVLLADDSLYIGGLMIWQRD